MFFYERRQMNSALLWNSKSKFRLLFISNCQTETVTAAQAIRDVTLISESLLEDPFMFPPSSLAVMSSVMHKCTQAEEMRGIVEINEEKPTQLDRQ